MTIHVAMISDVENVKLLGEYSFGNAFWMIILRFDVRLHLIFLKS